MLEYTEKHLRRKKALVSTRIGPVFGRIKVICLCFVLVGIKIGNSLCLAQVVISSRKCHVKGKNCGHRALMDCKWLLREVSSVLI